MVPVITKQASFTPKGLAGCEWRGPRYFQVGSAFLAKGLGKLHMPLVKKAPANCGCLEARRPRAGDTLAMARRGLQIASALG